MALSVELDSERAPVLTERELRGLRSSDKYAWLPVACIALFWVVIISTSAFRLEVLADHGADFGLTSWSQIWELAVGWRDLDRSFHPYEVLVVETVGELESQFGIALVGTFFVLVSRQQSRFTRKLWHALQQRS